MGFTLGTKARTIYGQPVLQPAHTSRWWLWGALGVLLLIATACGSSVASSPTSTRAHTDTHSAPGHRNRPSFRTTTTTGVSSHKAPKSSVSPTTKPGPENSSRPSVSSHTASRGTVPAPARARSATPAPVTAPSSTEVTKPPNTPPTTVATATTTTIAPKVARLAIRNFAFLPSPLIITAGTTVIVTNDDTEPAWVFRRLFCLDLSCRIGLRL